MVEQENHQLLSNDHGKEQRTPWGKPFLNFLKRNIEPTKLHQIRLIPFLQLIWSAAENVIKYAASIILPFFIAISWGRVQEFFIDKLYPFDPKAIPTSLLERVLFFFAVPFVNLFVLGPKHLLWPALKSIFKVIAIAIAMPFVAIAAFIFGEKINPFITSNLKDIFHPEANTADLNRAVKKKTEYSDKTTYGRFMAKHKWARELEQELVFIFGPAIKLFESQDPDHKREENIIKNRQRQYTLIAGLRNIFGGLIFDNSHYVKQDNLLDGNPRHSGLLFSMTKLALAIFLIPAARFGLLSSDTLEYLHLSADKFEQFTVEGGSWVNAAKAFIVDPLVGIVRSIVSIVTGLLKIVAAAINTLGVLLQRNRGDFEKDYEEEDYEAKREVGINGQGVITDECGRVCSADFPNGKADDVNSTFHGWHPRTVQKDIRDFASHYSSDTGLSA